MKRLSKAFLILSSLLYTAFLFYVYAYFADQSIIYLNVFETTLSFSNNTLFYVGLIIPFMIIALFLLLSSIVKKQAIGPKAYFKNESAREGLSIWSNSMGGVFNIFAGAVLSVVLFTNNEEGIMENGFLPFVIVGLGLIVLGVLWLPVILLKNK